MNATQVAVYFNALFPNSGPRAVNAAGGEFIHSRSKTEFGLSNPEILTLMKRHFKDVKGIDL